LRNLAYARYDEFLYNFRSLPETFGRIEVMELRLLLAYPSAVPEKAVAGFNLAAAFLFWARVERAELG
jgi:hypothetical protein